MSTTFSSNAAGNRFSWKTSNFSEVETGKTYTVTGTVKKHDEYNGIKQTTLIRCKVELVESPVAVAA